MSTPQKASDWKDHAIAQIFPMMPGDEKAKLIESIREHGLREEIVLLDGLILDGRNRLESCFEAGIKPRFRDYDYIKDGASPIDFVMDKNLCRRQLTPSQKAAVAAEALPFYQEEAAKRKRKGGQAAIANLSNQQPLPTPTPAPAAPAPAVPVATVEPTVTPEPTPKPKAKRNSKPKPPVTDAITTRDGLLFRGDTQIDLPKADTVAQAAGFPNAEQYVKHLVETAGSGTTKPKAKKKKAKPAGGTEEGAQPPATTPGKEDQAQTPPVPTPEPTPAPAAIETTEEKGRATQIAAAHAGVGETTVKQAKNLHDKHPELFAEVKAGTITINAAVAQTTAAQKAQRDFEEACQRIENVCGKSMAEAVRDGLRLKKKGEAVAYAALKDDQMISIRGLIEEGWTIPKALKFKMVSLTRGHKIGDLLDRAAAQGGIFIVEFGAFEIQVKRLEKAE